MIKSRIISTPASAEQNNIYIITDLIELAQHIHEPAIHKYILKQFDDPERSFVHINQYEYLLFIVKIKAKKDEHLILEKYRTTGNQILKKLNENEATCVNIIHPEKLGDKAFALAEGLMLGAYQFNKFKSAPAPKNSLSEVTIVSDELNESDALRLNCLVKSVYDCRNLVNEPAITLGAKVLAEYCEAVSIHSGIKTEVLNLKKIEALNMGGLLAVNKGSNEPPTFTIMEWKPSNAKNLKPIILVGKGVTFDTGGMNIKTGSYMDNMKMDMAGAATMISLMDAIAETKMPLYVIALLPATDNRVGPNAIVPGDVITMFDKTTVEVLNTDAEGRLILADALAYAKKYDPMLVITAATLTGSAVRAIGSNGIAAMENNAGKYTGMLSDAGFETYERIAFLPFWDDYADMIKSKVADIKNVGPSEAGAITAGKFLQHFTDYPFIHLDIAGPAFLDKPDAYRPFGGSGIGIRLLFNFFTRLIKTL